MAAFRRGFYFAALAVVAAVFAGLVGLTIKPRTWWSQTPNALKIDQLMSAGFAVLMVTLASLLLIGLRRRERGFGYWALFTVMSVTLVVAVMIISLGLTRYMPGSAYPMYSNQ